jgi:hypothetical protein
VRLTREMHGARRQPAGLELVDLGQEDLGVDDAARADHTRLAAEHPTRDLPDLEGLAVDDDRVARVRAALVATHEIRVLRQQIDDLPLPLVTPLCADDDCCGHGTESARRYG